MAIKGLYEYYLQRFGATVTLQTLATNPSLENVIGLRHDVDYNLDIALEMAWVEHERGCKSTYFLLHTQPYFNDKDFIEKCVQIQELGHEIGLHNNLLTEWVTQGINPVERLAELLKTMRGWGLNITGTSSHGDKLCYTHQYINAWLFSESAPSSSHTLLNPEGIPALDALEAITLPPDGILHIDGRKLVLGQASLADFGFNYQAHQLSTNSYFTDSGGSWQRSQDPLDAELERGRHQILVHPIWWAEKKIYFALSSARSGSTWLSNIVGTSTAVIGKHEFALNHFLEDGQLIADKRTGEGFIDFLQDRREIDTRLKSLRDWLLMSASDYFEANVYLIHVLEELKAIFPEATILHLHRDGRKVVRSLMNRGWYSTPEDDRHPRIEINNWASLNQLEKCCWYYRYVNETISNSADFSVSLEDIGSNEEGLIAFLERIGIKVVLPSLLTQEHARVLNAEKREDFPSFHDWTEDQQETFNRICGPTQRALGYEAGTVKTPNPSQELNRDQVILVENLFSERAFTSQQSVQEPVSAHECLIEYTQNGLQIEVKRPRIRHAHLYVGVGKWRRSTTTNLLSRKQDSYFRLQASIEIDASLNARIFILMYDKHGKLLSPSPSVAVRNNRNISIAFKADPRAVGFNYAIYFPKQGGTGKANLKHIKIWEISSQPQR